ncbi:c6 zinc finger domain containing protein [Grosmannia clavigera kw1407]|uniref:C6 zinc finger domain containing protein n=1 Tax=Grosmannia clavigera (strain kw1407 / UAMH 11150) TaxID=655863 RepID=F0XH84_GROCL|nr:c6 zinc finger domain containing protein [Grosmannia clavigera kw1407]EFX02660.1 c6 zinc finger domain containing protein [Grosmannia clavigera kw1407]
MSGVDTLAPSVKTVSDSGGASSDDDGAAVSVSSTTTGRDGKRKRHSLHKTSCELCKQRKVNRTYGSDLEAKVNRLDAMLRLLGRRVEDHNTAHGQAGPVGSDMSTPASMSSSSQSSMLDLFSVDLGISSYARGPAQQQRMQQPSPSPSSSQIQQGPGPRRCPSPSRSHRCGPPPPPASASSPPVGDAALVSDPDLPEPEIVYTLVDLYFKHVNTWCPILDRKATFAAFFGSTMLTEAKRTLLHAVIATTLRFCRDPRMPPARKAQFHRLSKQRVEHYALEHVNLEALEALVILSLDVLGTSNGPLGWNLLAMIVRSVIQLDLCTESSVFLAATSTPRTGSIRRVVLLEPTSWIEDESRQWLCWMVYVLDRYATVATSFDFMLDDRCLHLALPCRYDLFSNNVPVQTRSPPAGPDRSGRFARQQQRQQCRPATLAATTMALLPPLPLLLPPTSTLLPPLPSTSPPPPPRPPSSPLLPPSNNPQNLGKAFPYHCEVLRILSPRPTTSSRPPIDVTSPRAVQAWRHTFRALDGELNSWLHALPGDQNAAQRCLGAVRSLRDIAADVLDTNGLNLLGPPFAFALWVSARVLIVHAAVYDPSVVDGVMDFLIDTLRQMGTYWEVAATYARILSDIVAEGRRGDPSFAEMRRCACDVVDLANRQRHSSLEPTTTRPTTSRELDYVDVFDFFNYPKVAVPLSVAPSPLPYLSVEKVAATPDRGVPDFTFEAQRPDVDWLSFQPPHD